MLKVSVYSLYSNIYNKFDGKINFGHAASSGRVASSGRAATRPRRQVVFLD